MRIFRKAGFILLLPLLPLTARLAGAQTCPPATVNVNITVGDSSTPDPAEYPTTYITTGNSFCQTEAYGWGARTLTARCGGTNTIRTYSANYIARDDTVSCTYDGAGCLSCSPNSVSAPLFARYGNYVGNVDTLPSTRPSQNSWVTSTDGRYSCWYGPDGFYNCAWRGSALFIENDWSVSVFGDGHGPGTVTLTLQAPNGLRRTAATESSKAKQVDFHAWVGEPVDECVVSPPQVESAPYACSNPVSLTSGNVFFSHADASVAALGGDIQFIRTYNSVNRGDGLFGVFGRGWHHTYEQSLSAPEAGVLKLRRGTGRPIYFVDLDGDLRYDPTVPYVLESWIQKQPDGSYVRNLRKGGSETYDASGRLLTLVDAFGNTTTLAYVGSQLTTITAAGGRALTLTYTSGKISTLSGPAGTIATYTYDGSGRLAGVQYADTAVSGYTFTYDPVTGAIATVSDLAGRTLETHTYDGTGRGQVSEIAGGQERFTLTYLQNQTQVTTVDGTTTYDFDSFWGQQLVTKVTGPCDSCAGGSETQEWTYDAKGRVETHTDAEGLVTTYAYDPATGDLLSATETKGTTTRATAYAYDPQGRVLTVTAPDRGTVTYTQSAAGPTSVLDAINRTTSLTYTPSGQLETVTNPRLKTTGFAYAPATGDLTSVTDPLQKATTFGYDALGRRNRVTDPLNNSTTYIYDARGQLTRITFPDTKFVAYTYDKGGRRATVTDQLNRVTTYGYDTYGRLATVTDANTSAGITTYGYDAMSRLTTITDARQKTTTFHYDAFGRVDQVTYPGTPAAVETFTYYRRAVSTRGPTARV